MKHCVICHWSPKPNADPHGTHIRIPYWKNDADWKTPMPDRNDIINAIREATGDPASGPIHDWTPAIADAIDRVFNGGTTNTKPGKHGDTRIMRGAKNIRGE